METRINDSGLTRRKVLGVVSLILFSLAFIFCCMHKILPIGRVLLGTFGVLSFPMFIFLILVSLAKFLGFSYTRNKKATAYFCLALLSVLLFIQSISTFKQLNLVVGWKSLVAYLKFSYVSKITFLGSFGSLACGVISILLGAMGSIVIFVILATLFVGLFIDYHYYGKYEEPHVKKLKTRAVREKVEKSDKKRTSDQSPVYSFSNSIESDDVLGEITASENQVNSNSSIYEDINSYSQEDIVAEISNEDNFENVTEMNYQSGTYESQTQNQFDNNVYEAPKYPGIYDTDSDAHRREFMNATFGGYNTANVESNTFETTQDTSSSVLGTDFGSNLFGGLSGEESSSQDDAISKILNSTEEDVFADVNQSNVTSSSGFDMDFNVNEEQRKPVFSEPIFDSNNNNYAFNNGLQNLSTGVQKAPFESQISQPIIEPVRPKIEPVINQSQHKVPSQTKPINNNYGVNISIPGVRYNPPPLNLLATPKKDTGDYTAEQSRKTNQLENVLQAFNINAKVVNIVRGPKITRFELSLPYGTSVKQIPKYEDDIAAALAAKTITIRAPIPGSRYVGIELENDTFSTVYQRELFESDAFQNCKDPLPIAIGKDISGEIIVKSLADMTHLLIAGSTGSGKSVFIHNIVLSLLYKSSPEDLKLIMIDPKRVEFNRYNGLPHLMTPEVVMGSQKAINALKWCVKEMDRRYDLMSRAGFNNIKPYNKSELVKAGQFERFPYIVIIVDELAEIMQANKKEAESCIQRITQLARACGMHMVLATQRPSVDIITGVIKNNIPSRVAFSLQSGIDSKTILNSVGAEKLLGKGDMIFAPTGTSSTPRLQASYASDEEIDKIIDYVKRNNVANYDESVNNMINSEQQSSPDDASAGFVDAPPQKEALDPYFKTALELVMQNGGASVSYLQRRLSIGYSRAARIVDQMEDRGYIAPSTGAKLRKVLITPEQFNEEFGEN